jgi:methyl-accepting chemotaxis protein
VANGTREQSPGIARIGQAINELDQMTQQNAALVEQTAAAAAAMKDQDQALVQEVARFRLQSGPVLQDAASPVSVADFDFDKAIEAHRHWKVRLRKAIADHAHLDVDTICRDDQCPLGQWLHGAGGRRWGGRPGFVELLERHAEFHTTAGSVARQINAGAYADAERLIGTGSKFAQISNLVCTLLTRAKRGL